MRLAYAIIPTQRTSLYMNHCKHKNSNLQLPSDSLSASSVAVPCPRAHDDVCKMTSSYALACMQEGAPRNDYTMNRLRLKIYGKLDCNSGPELQSSLP